MDLDISWGVVGAVVVRQSQVEQDPGVVALAAAMAEGGVVLLAAPLERKVAVLMADLIVPMPVVEQNTQQVVAEDNGNRDVLATALHS